MTQTQTPGEYVGEAESRESDLLRQHILARLTIPRPDCMIWSGATDRGYGRIGIGRKAKRVHRVLWEIEHGPIPEGLTIDHLCRVRACCNTAHMELVTAAENVRRAAPYRPDVENRPRRMGLVSQRGSGPRTTCRRGHPATPENTYSRPDGRRECAVCRRERRGGPHLG